MYLTGFEQGAWTEKKRHSESLEKHTDLWAVLLEGYIYITVTVTVPVTVTVTVTVHFVEQKEQMFVLFLLFVVLSRQGVDETTIKTASLFVPVFVAACEGFCSKSPPFQNVFQSA